MSVVPDDASWLDDTLSALAMAPRQSRRDRPRSGLVELLARRGDPQHKIRAVRIAGSKGKGSTALIMEAMLELASYRVGVFTSPHIDHWCERVRLDGHSIPAAQFAGILAALAPDIDALRASADVYGPDLFEVCLVVALVAFERAGVDMAIVESGIGAATDATQVVPSVLSIITTIEAEHLDQIGPGLADVAREKAGVLARETPAVIGRLPAIARREICAVADTLACPCFELGRDFTATRQRRDDRRELYYRHGFYRLTTPATAGLYWLNDSVALAVTGVRYLPGVHVDVASMTAVMTRLCLPGRLEQLSSSPLIIADSAHTQASARLLAAMLADHSERPRILVLSCSKGHDPAVLAPELWHQIDRIVVTQAEPTRSRPAQETATRIERSGRTVARVEPRPFSALYEATRLAGPDGLVCATGSVYMAGQARAYVQRPATTRYPLSRADDDRARRSVADQRNRDNTC